MITLLLAIIYVSFISLGLPDGLLGAAWPSMYQGFAVPVSCAGIISMIIALGTIISSLLSDRLTFKLGTGKVTAFSVCLTAIAIFGFSGCREFWQVCLWAIPYGLGAGSVDASLNNFVALHYSSKHMSWLHCMWGIGAATGPYIMGAALSLGGSWNRGYSVVGIIQVVLTAVLFISLPMWKKMEKGAKSGEEQRTKPLSLKETVMVPGAIEIMITFFCYCAVEQTTALWASTYLKIYKGVPTELAATFASIFFMGITIGRFFNGFLTFKLQDKQLIRLGMGIISAGIVAMVLPLGTVISLIGFILIGLGCAPIYPCVIHSTPINFGRDKSQALIGVQMASAYVGTCLMPPLFGLIANHISLSLMPYYILLILILMFFSHERMLKKVKPNML